MNIILETLAIFFIKILLVTLALIAIIRALKSPESSKNSSKKQLNISVVNDELKSFATVISEVSLEKKTFKKLKKHLDKKKHTDKPKAFLLTFEGDMQASKTKELKDEISAILTIANADDEVIIRINSAGGSVSQYGYAASQLERIRQAKIPLTACIDKVGASGGYMMACVADTINAAPFAMVGSIGVWMGIPNFNDLMKKNHIDWEEITAGDHKRNLSLLGKVTHEDRLQAQQQADLIHQQFREHIAAYRPTLDIDQVSDGTVWLGRQALAHGLVDHIATSDEYIQTICSTKMVMKLNMESKKSLVQKYLQGQCSSLSKTLMHFISSWKAS